MATSAATGYSGPERRKSGDETREGYLVERKLRMDMLNALGRKAIVGVLIMGGWWVGRMETNATTTQETAKSVATISKTVGELAGTMKEMQERERAQVARDAAEKRDILVQLEKLNGQFELMRAEQQARTVRGEGR